jgi:hypothetical protein
MKNKKYKIKNLEAFSKKMLRLGGEDIGIDADRRSKYINLKNVEGIVKEKAIYKEETDALYITESIAENIIEEISNWLLGVEVAEMCSSGKLECYWDNKQNCMVFKVSDQYRES